MHAEAPEPEVPFMEQIRREASRRDRKLSDARAIARRRRIKAAKAARRRNRRRG